MRFAFFDLDDTLVDARAALRAWSVDFAAEFAAEYAVDLAAGGRDAAADVFELVEAVASWPKFVEEARARYGITASDERLQAQVADTLPSKFVLADRVRQGLAELREAGWRLGVVTNGTTLVQQAKVDSVGLRPFVDVVVDSEAAGARKPDRRIFEIAAGRLGVELGPRGWMVGDRLGTDIAGGQAVGLRTVWITQDPQLLAGSVRPTRAVATIGEAFDVMRTSAWS